MIQIFPNFPAPHRAILTGMAAFALFVGGCSPAARAPDEDEQTDAAPVPGETESISILRPEIEPPAPEPTKPALGPLMVTIGFPDGGSALDADALAALETVVGSEQMALGLPITLGAHSDSAGTDKANLDASETRGLAVAQWLIDKGVEPDRITVIAFGEQNQAAPNARPDGSADEEGRAANRRVEIEIAVPASEASAADEPKALNPEGSVEAGD